MGRETEEPVELNGQLFNRYYDRDQGPEVYQLTAGQLKPLVLNLYIFAGIGASTFGAVKNQLHGTYQQVGIAVQSAAVRFPLFKPLQWV